jgi:hypothetical protein
VVDDGDDEDDGAREREKQRQVRAAAALAEEVARTAAAELAQCEKDQARLTAERERRVRARQIAGQGRREARDRRERQRRTTTSQRGNKDAAEKEKAIKQATIIKRLTQAANKRAKVKMQNDRARTQAARQRRIEIHNMMEKLKEAGGGFKEFFLTCARLGVEQKAATRARARGTGRDGKRLSGAGEKAAVATSLPRAILNSQSGGDRNEGCSASAASKLDPLGNCNEGPTTRTNTVKPGHQWHRGGGGKRG